MLPNIVSGLAARDSGRRKKIFNLIAHFEKKFFKIGNF
jgi:hypothetical protein